MGVSGFHILQKGVFVDRRPVFFGIISECGYLHFEHSFLIVPGVNLPDFKVFKPFVDLVPAFCIDICKEKSGYP